MVKKKKGKIAGVAKMLKDGLSIKDAAEKTGLSQQVVRAYKWRSDNPEKYRALLSKYFTKRKQKNENEKIKATVEKSVAPEKEGD